MPFIEISSFKIFQFNNLSAILWLHHGISTRESGNLSTSVGDKKEAFANRQTFFKGLGISEKEVVEAKQVHGNHVAVVGKKESGHMILQTDALITSEPNVPLFIKVADCVPILLVDPVKKAISVVHAGWRGTAQEVTRLTVQHMQDHFGTDPADIFAGIGPSIGPCCYEVDNQVIDQFKYKFKYADKLLSKVRGNRANLDLWLANKFQLIETGVKEENIEIANLCTHDNPNLFFSERKEGKTGRLGTIIWIE